MAWGFGNISASTSMKSMAVDEKDKIKDYILVNHYMDGEDYYLFLIEGMPKNNKLVDKIKADIEKAGYQSYIIASATNCTFDKDKVKVLKEHMKTFKTEWMDLVRYQGVKPSAIMAFGAALYAINKDTDLTTDCFYDQWMNKPYYYLGHGFIGDFDTFIFPVNSIDEIFPTFDNPESDPTNWKTRFFRSQLKNMLGNKEYPYDMSDFTITVAEEA